MSPKTCGGCAQCLAGAGCVAMVTFSSSCLSCLVLASREHMVCWGATTVQIHLPSLSWAELYTCHDSSGFAGSTCAWRKTKDRQHTMTSAGSIYTHGKRQSGSSATQSSQCPLHGLAFFSAQYKILAILQLLVWLLFWRLEMSIPPEMRNAFTQLVHADHLQLRKRPSGELKSAICFYQNIPQSNKLSSFSKPLWLEMSDFIRFKL